MGWETFHRRRRVMQDALEFAREHPGRPLELDDIPAARDSFSSTEDLLCALHHTWTQLLIGRIEVAAHEAEQQPHGDRVQAVATAWARAADDHPVLRWLLDQHAPAPPPELRRAFAAEQRLLALTSGLAGLDEPAGSVERVGTAFLRLVRLSASGTAGEHEHRRNPLRKLLAHR